MIKKSLKIMEYEVKILHVVSKLQCCVKGHVSSCTYVAVERHHREALVCF
jgi:uncharacterized alkaline shock family protein YloU